MISNRKELAFLETLLLFFSGKGERNRVEKERPIAVLTLLCFAEKNKIKEKNENIASRLSLSLVYANFYSK